MSINQLQPLSNVAPEGKPRRTAKRKIMFVCTGNICRSPMAEYILKDILKQHDEMPFYSVSSCGLAACKGLSMTKEAQEALKELGIKSASRHRAKIWEDKFATSYDLVLTMTENHRQQLPFDNAFALGELVNVIDVADPYGGSLDSYRRTAAQLKYMIEKLYCDVFPKISKDTLHSS